MERLNMTNTQPPGDFHISATWFDIFFKALEDKDQKRSQRASETIAQVFVTIRKQIEQMTDKLAQTADDFESLAKLHLVTLSKELIELLQDDW